MSRFLRELQRLQPNPENRKWLYVPYDQLSDDMGPLSREKPEELGIILIENAWKAARRPYHKQKLALILANMRHFALEQASRGVAVRYEIADGLYRDALEPLVGELATIQVMEPAEYELSRDLRPLVESGKLKVIEHEGWLTTERQFRDSQKSDEPPWRMDAFYRHVRQCTGVLMESDKPVGGKYSFDAENREPWSGEPATPEPPRFAVDPIKQEVGELLMQRFGRHPGDLDLERLPATAADAQRAWQWAVENCLRHFGPYEDAMSTRSTTIFHTRISALLNIHRLLPKRVVSDVAEMDLPLASKEGFIRQMLGWREFVGHVHRQTNGFRKVGNRSQPVAEGLGDGGYRRWSGESWTRTPLADEPDGGARPSYLGDQTCLPPAYWGAVSGLACLDRVVTGVWQEAYSHHITRLMVLANLATLLDVSPRELTDWFWVAYVDAFDWVVEPNVLGMGTFSAGDVMSTKPYVSGAAYINKMSDFCAGCVFDPKQNCPITNLYWAFLSRHRERLADNPRMKLALASLQRRSAGKQAHDLQVFEMVKEKLNHAERIKPSDL